MLDSFPVSCRLLQKTSTLFYLDEAGEIRVIVKPDVESGLYKKTNKRETEKSEPLHCMCRGNDTKSIKVRCSVSQRGQCSELIRPANSVALVST